MSLVVGVIAAECLYLPIRIFDPDRRVGTRWKDIEDLSEKRELPRLVDARVSQVSQTLELAIEYLNIQRVPDLQ